MNKSFISRINFKKIRSFIFNGKFLIPLFIFLVLCSFAFYYFVLRDLPNPMELKNYKIIPVATQILDRNGKLLYEVYRDQKRTTINLSEMPTYIKEATISIEDKDFYHHQGISLFSGVFRALRDMVLHQGLQGGSTLTQQLVKSALLTPERTVQRKIKEIILAIWTEQLFSKDQILEMYLNQVPYGGNSYGIEEASNTYFGKHAKDLDVAQATYLVGLPQAPSLYSPYSHPDLAKQRQEEVVDNMIRYGYIKADQKDKILNEKLSIKPQRSYIKAPHFVFYVKDLLEQQYGADEVELGGLKVYTTLDLDLQEKAEAIVKDEVAKAAYMDVGNGAALITRPPTGEILGMVGSTDYFATPSGSFNVTTALRQPGSSIKPFNYAIGIDRKLVTPATVFLDVPTCFPGGPEKYCPVNYDGKFHGPVQLRFALGNSFNIPAVKMLQMNGVANFVASAPAFLITTFDQPDRYGLSLTLGGGEVRMTEMAQAFSAFANEGVPKKLVSILKVEDKRGNVLYQYKDPNFVQDIKKALSYPNFLLIQGKRAISKETSFLISHILLDNNARIEEFGGSSALVVPKRTVSVKTGTTDDKRDNWTFGYTPNFLVAAWVGNDDNSPMSQALASGITGAAPIWNRIMVEVLKNQPDLFPRKPEGVVGKQVCADGSGNPGKDADGKDTCPLRFEYFIKGTENMTSNVSIAKEKIFVNKDNGKQAQPGDTNIEEQEKTVATEGTTKYCLDCAH